MRSQPRDVGPEEATNRYEAYKASIQEKAEKNFFDAHSKNEWLKELYDPSLRRASVMEDVNALRQRYTQFDPAMAPSYADGGDRMWLHVASATAPPAQSESPSLGYELV